MAGHMQVVPSPFTRSHADNGTMSWTSCMSVPTTNANTASAFIISQAGAAAAPDLPAHTPTFVCSFTYVCTLKYTIPMCSGEGQS